MLPSDDGGLRRRLISILRDPGHGLAIRDDLRAGFSVLPEWMRAIVRDLLRDSENTKRAVKGRPPRRGSGARRQTQGAHL